MVPNTSPIARLSLELNVALENNFFLEAIALQESIISDRIISFLSRPDAPHLLGNNKNGQFPSFNKLINSWRKDCQETGQADASLALIDAVDRWRRTRNEALHAMVKSAPGEPSQPIELFLQKAKESAEEGAELARSVCDWRQK